MKSPWSRLALVLGFAVALRAYDGILVGYHWWWNAVAIVLLVGVLGYLVSGRMLRVLAQLVGLIVAIGVVLGSTVFTALGSHVTSGARTMWLDSPPVSASADVQLLVLAWIGVFAVLIGAWADVHGAVWPGAVAFLSLLVMPSTLSGDSPHLWVLALTAAVWLMIVWLEHRQDQGQWRRPAIAVVATTVTATGLFSLLPTPPGSVWEWGSGGPGTFSAGVNPILELGQDLKRGSNRDVLSYSSEESTPSYIKLGTLSYFTGETWQPSEFATTESETTATSLLAGATTRTLDIDIKDLDSARIPVPFPATVVRGIDEMWTWMRPGATAQLVSGGVSGLKYEVDYLDRNITLETMEAATTGNHVEPQYANVPDDSRVEDLAEIGWQAVGDASSSYDVVKRLQDWFRSDFTYDVNAPSAQGYDGNGLDDVFAFLDAKSGYCVHFASTMAVMLRAMGFPARVAVGYAPASRMTVKDGRRIWTNSSHDAHAWVEVQFDDVGWISFDPTPSIGVPTALTSDASTASTPTPTPAATPAPSTKPSSRAPEDAAAKKAVVSARAWRVVGALVAGLLVVLAGPWLVRAGRSRRRLRRGDPDPWWREVLDVAVDLGIEIDESATVREVGQSLVDHGAPSAATQQLVEIVEHHRYSRETRDAVSADAARDVIAGLRAAATSQQRTRATLAPRSLKH
jgi:transglutaminase-like putative cysteine protease